MNNDVNNNELNNVSPTVDQNSTPVETPVAEATPEVATPVQTETAPVEPTTEAPAETPAEPTPAEPRLVQIKPSIGGGSLTPNTSTGSTVVAGKKQSIVPVIVLIVGLIGLVISGFWLYNELNHKDDTTSKPNVEKLPFSGAFNPSVTTTTPTTNETETTTTVAAGETVTNAIIKYPDFKGKTVDEVTKWASELGIEVKVETVTEEGAQAGTVVRQNREADAVVNDDEAFVIYVAN